MKLSLEVVAQGPMTWVKRAETYRCNDVTHKNMSNRKLPIVLLKQEDFPHFRGLEQLSSPHGWQILAGKVITDILVSAVLKRLFIIEFKMFLQVNGIMVFNTVLPLK